MTDVEVRAAWPAAREIQESGYYLLGVIAPVSVSGVTYEAVRFIFDTKGRLREVRLEANEPYGRLRERIAGQLGAPVTDEDKPFFGTVRSKSAVFRDAAKGNIVKISSFTGGKGEEKSFLTYRPLEDAF